MGNKEIEDKKFDAMMRALIADASLDESSVDRISGSPALWRSIKHAVAEQQTSKAMPWPPIGKIFRWVMIVAPAGAAAALVAFFLMPTASVPSAELSSKGGWSQIVTTTKAADPIPVVAAVNSTEKAPIKSRHLAGASVKPSALTQLTASNTEKKTEIKSDFIALSYARNPDSGQIVRVKVPGAMMVSLGLVQSVSKPSDLVDAEVLVGDDGLTRAIRFIRQ